MKTVLFVFTLFTLIPSFFTQEITTFDGEVVTSVKQIACTACQGIVKIWKQELTRSITKRYKSMHSETKTIVGNMGEVEYTEILNYVCEEVFIDSAFVHSLIRLNSVWLQKIQDFCFDLLDKKTETAIYNAWRIPGLRLQDFVCFDECITKIRNRKTKEPGQKWNSIPATSSKNKNSHKSSDKEKKSSSGDKESKKEKKRKRKRKKQQKEFEFEIPDLNQKYLNEPFEIINSPFPPDFHQKIQFHTQIFSPKPEDFQHCVPNFNFPPQNDHGTPTNGPPLRNGRPFNFPPPGTTFDIRDMPPPDFCIPLPGGNCDEFRTPP